MIFSQNHSFFSFTAQIGRIFSSTWNSFISALKRNKIANLYELMFWVMKKSYNIGPWYSDKHIIKQRWFKRLWMWEKHIIRVILCQNYHFTFVHRNVQIWDSCLDILTCPRGLERNFTPLRNLAPEAKICRASNKKPIYNWIFFLFDYPQKVNWGILIVAKSHNRKLQNRPTHISLLNKIYSQCFFCVFCGTGWQGEVRHF